MACVYLWLAVLSGCLLTDVDEVTRSLGLAGDVRLEISIDAVFHFAVKGLVQQRLEALQTVRVVGQTEFTVEYKQRRITIPPVSKNMSVLCLVRPVTLTVRGRGVSSRGKENKSRDCEMSRV